MKKLVMIMMTLAATQVFAYADQEQVVVQCEQTQVTPDNMLFVRVLTGGFAGLTRLEATQSMFVGARTTNFYVKQVKAGRKSLVYSSKTVQLAIDLTNADAQGKFASTLTVKSAQGQNSTAMTCELK